MSTAARFPPWLRRRVPAPSRTARVRDALGRHGLHTVCREARCPNVGECFAEGTATFMILGSTCTRDCRFCAVAHGDPLPPDPGEALRVAEAARELGLRHVVVTSVTRDDLPDGGSGHFAATVRAVHQTAGATVEVLTPDFDGAPAARVLDAGPEVFNHNVETVPRLYPTVRPAAAYERSLQVLCQAARSGRSPIVKSGLMLGLGESEDEVLAVMADVREVGCRVVTLGQYLAPSKEHCPVVEFVPPERFEQLRCAALEMGFDAALSGPFVRSSYRAAHVTRELLGPAGPQHLESHGG
jgi:lipoic acid synthetase